MTKLIFTGVYFTAMKPSKGKEEIKQNNWDDNSSKISDTKVQAAVKVSMPTHEVEKHTTKDGREIYKSKSGDVDLTAHTHEIHDNKWDGKD